MDGCWRLDGVALGGGLFVSALLPSVPGSFGFFVSGLIEAVGWLIFCPGGRRRKGTVMRVGVGVL